MLFAKGVFVSGYRALACPSLCFASAVSKFSGRTSETAGEAGQRERAAGAGHQMADRVTGQRECGQHRACSARKRGQGCIPLQTAHLALPQAHTSLPQRPGWRPWLLLHQLVGQRQSSGGHQPSNRSPNCSSKAALPPLGCCPLA